MRQPGRPRPLHAAPGAPPSFPLPTRPSARRVGQPSSATARPRSPAWRRSTPRQFCATLVPPRSSRAAAW